MKKVTEHFSWDGVRNYQAANIIKHKLPMHKKF